MHLCTSMPQLATRTLLTLFLSPAGTKLSLLLLFQSVKEKLTRETIRFLFSEFGAGTN